MEDVMKIMDCLLIPAFVLLLFSGTALRTRSTCSPMSKQGKFTPRAISRMADRWKAAKCWFMTVKTSCFLEGVTDKKGLFSFPVPKVDDLTIVIEATMGHKNSFKLKKAEVEAGK